MQIGRAGALLVSLSLAACGGDDGGGTRLVDSGIGNSDGGQRVCSTANIGASDVTGEGAGRYLTYFADLGMINGDPAALYMEFYHTTNEPTLPATVDLSSEANKDYSTCTVCFLAVTFDAATQEVQKIFFQESGTVTFPTDPITARQLEATVTNLKLQEIEFDQNTGATVFLPAGECANVASATLSSDNIPDEWTCDASAYYTAATGGTPSPCDCSCGYYDPDCRVPAATTNGCSNAAMPVCWPNSDTGDSCVAAPAGDTCTATSPLITVGTPVTATSVGAARNYNMGLETSTCTMYRQPGPDVAYRVALTAGTAYTVALTALDPEFDGSIAVVGPSTDGAVCTDAITTCVAGKDQGFDGDDETLTYTPTTSGTYFIIVDSYNLDDGGAFTLSVTGP